MGPAARHSVSRAQVGLRFQILTEQHVLFLPWPLNSPRHQTLIHVPCLKDTKRFKTVCIECFFFDVRLKCSKSSMRDIPLYLYIYIYEHAHYWFGCKMLAASGKWLPLRVLKKGLRSLYDAKSPQKINRCFVLDSFVLIIPSRLLRNEYELLRGPR